VRYVIDYDNRPVDVENAARDRICWFFSLDYAGRRQYSEDTATNVYYEQMATHWGNWAKLFFNTKGVAAHSTDVCAHYPPNDPSVWDACVSAPISIHIGVGTERPGARRPIALAPMAAVTIRSPAVSPAQCAKGKWWDPTAKRLASGSGFRCRGGLDRCQTGIFKPGKAIRPLAMGSPSCWSLVSPRCIPDACADGRRPLTWIPGIALRDVHLASRRGLPRAGAVT
jgi:hypothetical protein